MKIHALTVRMRYWRPGADYAAEIVKAAGPYLADGDILAISEKAISTAMGNLVDEAAVHTSRLSRALSGAWTRKVWGGPLGRITKLKEKTLDNLRRYPPVEGARHKQAALSYAGFLQSLRHYSEGGIDASNLPYTLVSLPLKEPRRVAETIRDTVRRETGRDVTVMIVDGDTTYSWRSLHLAPRRVSTPGLVHFGGFLTFVLGRALGLKARQTPVAVAGEEMNPDRALWLASLYHSHSGRGAGRTVWGMAESMDTDITGVTWEMLDTVPHHPIAVIRIG